MVLFDEVEKAHGDVFNILLQVSHCPLCIQRINGRGSRLYSTAYLIVWEFTCAVTPSRLLICGLQEPIMGELNGVQAAPLVINAFLSKSRCVYAAKWGRNYDGS